MTSTGKITYHIFFPSAKQSFPRFSNQVSGMIKLPSHINSIIIGLLLSDGWLIFASKTSKNALLGFAQSGDNSKYFWFVFGYLTHYCSTYPTIRNRTRLGNPTVGLQFFTRSLPCFTELHTLFYPKGKKSIPLNIYDLLTPVALAYLIMGVLRRTSFRSGVKTLCGFLWSFRGS